MSIYKARYELLIGEPYKISKEDILIGPEVPRANKLKAIEDSITKAEEEKLGYKIFEHNISFKVDKSSASSTPNKAEITVDNFSDDVVNYLTRHTGKKLTILLKAGFESTTMNTIFVGTIESFTDDFDNPTRKTKIVAVDGGVNMQETHTYRYYPQGTNVDTIVRDLISDTFLPRGGANVYATGETTIKPLYFNGSVISQLIKLADMYDYNVSIQDGTVFWTPLGRMVSKEVLKLTKDSGLIGNISPIDQTNGISQNRTSKTNTGIKFKCLLNSDLVPETVVYLEDSGYDGAYKLSKVKHTGQLEGNHWETYCEAEEAITI